MATSRRRKSPPPPKGRGGQSGFGNPRNDDRVTDEQHEAAQRLLDKEYRNSVRSHAEEVRNLVDNEGMDEGDALHQVVDGSYWVIYTHANFQVLMCTDHHDAYTEDFGEPPVEGGDIKWAALAYAALARDVQEAMSRLESSVDEAPRRRTHEAREHGPRGLIRGNRGR